MNPKSGSNGTGRGPVGAHRHNLPPFSQYGLPESCGEAWDERGGSSHFFQVKMRR